MFCRTDVWSFVLCTTYLRFSHEKKRLATKRAVRVKLTMQQKNYAVTRKENRSRKASVVSTYTGISPICQRINHRIDWLIALTLITSGWRLSTLRIRAKANGKAKFDFASFPTYFNLFFVHSTIHQHIQHSTSLISKSKTTALSS